jgi:hypothetical protein
MCNRKYNHRQDLEHEEENQMTLLPYGVCTIGLLSVVMLAWGLRQLRPQKQAVQRFMGIDGIHMLTRGLLLIPLLAVLGLVTAYLIFYLDGNMLRIAHGLFIFGLWTLLTVVFFLLALTSRLGIRPAIQTLASPVLAVPLVAYLTPAERFADVFSPLPPSVPMIVGLVLTTAVFSLILGVRKELL